MKEELLKVADLLEAPDNGVRHVVDSYSIVDGEGKLTGYCALGKIGILSGIKPSSDPSFRKALQEKFPSLTPQVQEEIMKLNDSGASLKEIAARLRAY